MSSWREGPDQDLERDFVAGLGVDGSVHRAHPAGAERLENAVAPDLRLGPVIARRFGSRIQFIHRVARSSSSPGTFCADESSPCPLAIPCRSDGSVRSRANSDSHSLRGMGEQRNLSGNRSRLAMWPAGAGLDRSGDRGSAGNSWAQPLVNRLYCTNAGEGCDSPSVCVP